MASKIGGITQRLLLPFTESVIVPVYLVTGRAQAAAAKLTDQLFAASLVGGTTTAFMVAAGAETMRIVSGRGYRGGVWVVLVLALAATIRTTYPSSSGRMAPLLSLRAGLPAP